MDKVIDDGRSHQCRVAGVPFLVKDIAVAMSGKRLELGSRLSSGVVAPADSWPMSRFRAADAVPLAHATYAAGSIRVPASYNGLFGLNPTRRAA
ncbi:amidase family protein [Pandoraea sp. SD6-2]|uniref:amidase family protein n=1 Tax=Pandoraea sp. SD6-2 TaxID=1286093 RepID=UPI00032E25FA|nr:6-aminohexanoate-cyclic-dimer hydrolase [Pandoraea sp. SD6-2]